MSKLIDISKITTILNKIKTYINNKLSSLVINSDLIADGAITTSKIGGGAITQDKIASSVSFSNDTIINLGNIYSNNFSRDDTYSLSISKWCQTNTVCFSAWIYIPYLYSSNIDLKVKYSSTGVTKTFYINLYCNSESSEYFLVHFLLKYNDGNPLLSHVINTQIGSSVFKDYDLVSTKLNLLSLCMYGNSFIDPAIDSL